MATQQQERRREKPTTGRERDMEVEKDIVPKRATHFEELATKVSDSAAAAAASVDADRRRSTVTTTTTVVSKPPGEGHRGTGVGRSSGGTRSHIGTTQTGGAREEHHNKKNTTTAAAGETPEFESISDKVKGLEEEEEEEEQQPGRGVGKFVMEEDTEKGNKNNEMKSEGKQQHDYDKKQTPSLEEISSLRQTAQQNSLDSIQAAQLRYEKAKEQAANAAWEAKEAAKHGLGAAGAKTSELATTAQEKARSGVGATTQYISDKSHPVAQTASEKAQQAKEAMSTAGQKSVEYTGEKAVQAKDTTVSTTKKVAGYVGEKAVAAKDVAVQTGKTAAEYAGKLAEDVKDQAVVTGWGAAHFTTEAAVGATKKAGGAAVVAKDAVANAAHKATELAEIPVVKAKDVAVDTGEKIADYAARKKMEAERYKEERQHQYYESGESRCPAGEEVGNIHQGVEKVKEKGRGRGTTESPQGGGVTERFEGRVRERGSTTNEVGEEGEIVKEKGEGLLGAIGETIVEIAQHTTNLVGGTGPQVQPGVIARENKEVQDRDEY